MTTTFPHTITKPWNGATVEVCREFTWKATAHEDMACRILVSTRAVHDLCCAHLHPASLSNHLAAMMARHPFMLAEPFDTVAVHYHHLSVFASMPEQRVLVIERAVATTSLDAACLTWIELLSLYRTAAALTFQAEQAELLAAAAGEKTMVVFRQLVGVAMHFAAEYLGAFPEAGPHWNAGDAARTMVKCSSCLDEHRCGTCRGGMEMLLADVRCLLVSCIPVFGLKLAVCGATGATLESCPAAPLVALVADDDLAVRHVVARMLEKLGYAVIEAEDGEKALGIIATHHVGAAVLDVAMPLFSGLWLNDACGLLHAADALVCISGFNFAEEAAAHAVAYLQKPFHLAQLESEIAKAHRRSAN